LASWSVIPFPQFVIKPYCKDWSEL
jgi:hypothetical protein